jgi:hypothetical protein
VSAGAPDPDEQIHREHRKLIEEEQHEQIERHEHSVHTGHERQQQRVELLAARGHGPRREHARKDDDGRQKDHQQADPIDAELVVDAERRHQRHLFVELEARGQRRVAVVGQVEAERQHGGDAGRRDGNETHRERTAPRGEHDQQRADERHPRDQREDRQAHGYRSCAQTSRSSTPSATP